MKKVLTIMAAMLTLAVFAYAQITLPYLENFDAVEAPDMPVGWVVENVNGDIPQWRTDTSSAISPLNCLHMVSNGNGLAMDDWALSPAFNLTAGTSYTFTFKYRSGGINASEQLAVYLGNAATVAAMNVEVAELTFATYDYIPVTARIIVPTSGNYYLGFYAHSEPWTYSISIDDVSLVVGATTLAEPVLTISKVSGGVQLDWNEVTGANTYKIYASNDITTSPDTWGLPIATTDSLTYLYTGAESYKFFVVRASADMP